MDAQKPIKYQNALPARPAAMGVQKGRLYGSGSGVASSVSINNILLEFQETYTDTCFRRTAPYGGTMPLSFERWLRAVDLATQDKGTKGNFRAKASTAAALFGLVDKGSDTSYVNLCRMTAEPFPLISSGRAATSDSVNSKAQPLIDPQTYFATAQRYARVMLSELGKLAVRWYKKYKMEDIDQHRSIIPLSLFRKTHIVTLGFGSEMRPLNPSEVFYLMAKLIEYYDRNTKQWHDLSDADIAEYFKGPDVGEGYVVFMSDEALMSLYSAGRASALIVPDIQVNIDEKTVVFQRPVLDSPTRELGKYFLQKLEAQMQAIEYKPLYRSFTYTDADVNGNYTTLKGCDFYGNSPETVKAELWGDIKVQKRIVMTNVILEPTKDGKGVLVDEGIHYKADCKSIPETLKMHIEWEKECQLKNYREQARHLEEELRVSKLLEKVTRPPVAKYVHSIMANANRVQVLLDELGKDADTELKRTAFADGVWFDREEANEIFRERVGATVVAGTKIQILAILFKRDAYKDLWVSIENQLAEVKKILANPDIIYDFIYAELQQWMHKDEWKRKSQVCFLADGGYKAKPQKETLVYYTAPSPEYDKLNMPCSIYYNQAYVAKSYGVNMNVLLPQGETRVPSRVLNCTTQDYVAIFHGTTRTYTPVSAITNSPIYFGDVIKAVLPYSSTSRLMVNILRYETKADGQVVMAGSYYRIIQPGEWEVHPRTGIVGLDVEEFIEGFVYLDDGVKAIDIRTVNGVKRVDIEEVPVTSAANPYPLSFGTVTDIRGVYDWDEDYPVMLSTYTDVAVERNHKTEASIENGWLSEVRVLTGDYGPKFSSHIEYYYNTIYLSNWSVLNLTIEQKRHHGKKGIITENRWLRPSDALSNLINKKLLSEHSITRGSEIRCLMSYETSAYRRWNIDELEDWTVIDKRFGCQTVAPKNPAAMQIYLEYMTERFKGSKLKNTLPTAVMAAKSIRSEEEPIETEEALLEADSIGEASGDIEVVPDDWSEIEERLQGPKDNE